MERTVYIKEVQIPEWINPEQQPCAASEPYVHIWKFPLFATEKVNQKKEVLTLDEQQRYLSFHQARDRARYFTSRYWLRRILSRYLACPYEVIIIKYGKNNKPCIQAPASPEVHFNLSHAGDYVVLAISGTETGIDVEHVNPAFQYNDIIACQFSEEEKKYILSGSKPAERFFSLWTRKEALLKADGTGLTDDLTRIPSLEGVHRLPEGVCAASQVLLSFPIDDHHIAAISFAKNTKHVDFYTMPANTLQEPLLTKTVTSQAEFI